MSTLDTVLRAAGVAAVALLATSVPGQAPASAGSPTSQLPMPRLLQAEEIMVHAQSFESTDPVAPDSVVSYQPLIHNAGAVTAESVLLILFDDDYAQHVQRFSNCLYPEDGSTEPVTCELGIDLAPGETAQVPASSAVQLHVLPNVPHGELINATYTVQGFTGELTGPDGVPGEGPEQLELVKIQDPGFTGDSEFANVLFTAGDNPADFAAVGAEITGTVGDVVTVAVGIENHGPADLGGVELGEGSVPIPVAVIEFPPGVTVREVLDPEGDLRFVSTCAPVLDGVPQLDRRNEADGRLYHCFVSEIPLPPGDSWLFPFEVEITGTATSTGEVTVTEGPKDPNPANNTAAIRVDPEAGGAGGELPATGADPALAVGAGLAVLVAGIGLLLLAHRRRAAG
jgi:LPXTG-motif cell wall-anchored protein